MVCRCEDPDARVTRAGNLSQTRQAVWLVGCREENLMNNFVDRGETSETCALAAGVKTEPDVTSPQTSNRNATFDYYPFALHQPIFAAASADVKLMATMMTHLHMRSQAAGERMHFAGVISWMHEVTLFGADA